jgi:RNA polymerase sigma-70 factor (ECF subfamily)
MLSRGDVTGLLTKARHGDREAEAQLLPLVYDELLRLARGFMRRERQGHTLQTTALVHEAYLRLATQETDVANRAHFFALAARQMRRVLVDHARGRLANKRGAGLPPLNLNDQALILGQPHELVEALDEALDRLAELDKRQSQIVEMRFFGGLTEEEIASVLGLSTRTVKRDWLMAKSWLYTQLK